MKRTWMLLIFAFVGMAGLANARATEDGLTVLLAKATADLGGDVLVPVYLPSRLPSEVSRYGVKFAFAQRTDGGYEVSLYYSEDTSDATFAGMIAGSSTAFPSLPNTKVVHLGSGTEALFRQVSCGRSCAPANLWWRARGMSIQSSSNCRRECPRKINFRHCSLPRIQWCFTDRAVSAFNGDFS